jgi:hypothetical protein
MQKSFGKFKAGVTAAAALVALVGAYGLRKLQALAADPTGPKDCRAADDIGEQGKIDLEKMERSRRFRA